MESTLHALGGILLRATPTFFLVFLLTFYLKKVFFQPLEKVLQQRYEATEGSRKLAEQTVERASAKAAEYEAAMRTARAEIYKAREQSFKELQERRAADTAGGRRRGSALASWRGRPKLPSPPTWKWPRSRWPPMWGPLPARSPIPFSGRAPH